MFSVDRLIWKTSIYGRHFFFFQALNDLVTSTHGKIIPPNQIQRLCRMTHALVGTILHQLIYYAKQFPRVIS